MTHNCYIQRGIAVCAIPAVIHPAANARLKTKCGSKRASLTAPKVSRAVIRRQHSAAAGQAVRLHGVAVLRCASVTRRQRRRPRLPDRALLLQQARAVRRCSWEGRRTNPNYISTLGCRQHRAAYALAATLQVPDKTRESFLSAAIGHVSRAS